MMIDTLLIAVFAALSLGGAAVMLLARHPMHVALGLITTMISLGGIYGLLGVHVIAVFQILIYVSAVMVFVVYVIMLLDTRDASFSTRFSGLLIPAAIVTGLLAALALTAVMRSVLAVPAGAVKAGAFDLQQFSAAFLAEYWLHFELTSVLLVAAVVAAIAVIKGAEDRRG